MRPDPDRNDVRVIPDKCHASAAGTLRDFEGIASASPGGGVSPFHVAAKALAAYPTFSAGRWQGTKDLRGIATVTGKGNGQGGSHVQRKYPGIDFHRARILMPGQCLDDLPGLPVIKHA